MRAPSSTEKNLTEVLRVMHMSTNINEKFKLNLHIVRSRFDETQTQLVVFLKGAF